MAAPVGLDFDRVACSSELALDAEGKPPTEFRLFKPGINQTSKGDFLWDAKAAEATLARFQLEGVDLMIDLEHDSIDDTIRAHRADAGDARGWCQLAVRDGELWAVNVRWTPDGVRRLSERTQRYISPVTLREKKTKRVVGLHNLALCAMPATYGAQPLVAASKRSAGASLASCYALLTCIVALSKRTPRRLEKQ